MHEVTVQNILGVGFFKKKKLKENKGRKRIKLSFLSPFIITQFWNT